jgi:hypothetical protein
MASARWPIGESPRSSLELAMPAMSLLEARREVVDGVPKANLWLLVEWGWL